MKHVLTSGLTAVFLSTLALAPIGNAEPARMSLDMVTRLDPAMVGSLLKSAEIEVGVTVDETSVEFKLDEMEGVAVLFGDDESGEGPFYELMYQVRFDNPDVDANAVNELNTISRFLRAYTQEDVVYIEWDVAVSAGVSTDYLESMTTRFTVAVREAKKSLED